MSQRIDILLGADYYNEIVLNQRLKAGDPGPHLQQTHFGWVVIGPFQLGNMTDCVTSNVVTCDTDRILKQFWEIEELPERKHLSEEEYKCEEHFLKTLPNQGRTLCSINSI